MTQNLRRKKSQVNYKHLSTCVNDNLYIYNFMHHILYINTYMHALTCLSLFEMSGIRIVEHDRLISIGQA